MLSPYEPNNFATWATLSNPFNPVWTTIEFTVEKCFSCFFLILYISNVIKNAYIFFPPQKLKIWRHGEKNQLFVYFDQKLKTAILDLFSTKLKVQDLKSKKKKKKSTTDHFWHFLLRYVFRSETPIKLLLIIPFFSMTTI